MNRPLLYRRLLLALMTACCGVPFSMGCNNPSTPPRPYEQIDQEWEAGRASRQSLPPAVDVDGGKAQPSRLQEKPQASGQFQ